MNLPILRRRIKTARSQLDEAWDMVIAEQNATTDDVEQEILADLWAEFERAYTALARLNDSVVEYQRETAE